MKESLEKRTCFVVGKQSVPVWSAPSMRQYNLSLVEITWGRRSVGADEQEEPWRARRCRQGHHLQ